jgi:hypothetical protein
MRECVGIFVVIVATLPCYSQIAASRYQPGTIISVVRRQKVPGQQHGNTAQYDVSVRVGDTTYVALYTPPNGANEVEYSAGLSILVMVRPDTLTFNSKISGKTEVPILRQETVTAQSGLDWSKLPSQYFNMKQQHLSETLDLTQDQLTQIKPMLEQEAGEAGQVLGNPVLSRKDQLNRWEKIVRSTDVKMKPLLSQAQLIKLKDMRNQQKQELKRMIAQQNSAKPN